MIQKKLANGSTFSTFTMLEVNNKNSNIIPIIFPGIGR